MIDFGAVPGEADAGLAELPAATAAALGETGGPYAVFDALMVALCRDLAADRCFLYLRDPIGGRAAVVACASVDGRWPDLRSAVAPEPEDLARVDPLMGWAHRSAAAIFVSDIETAGEEVLDVAFEREGFGHRALIHAPIVGDGRLLGILEPCVFAHPREWSAADRSLIAEVQHRLAPLAEAALHDGPFAASGARRTP